MLTVETTKRPDDLGCLRSGAAAAWTPLLICCWSVQEIRRITIKLTQQRIQSAHVAWSLWRRAHEAKARHACLKRKMQLLLVGAGERIYLTDTT